MKEVDQRPSSIFLKEVDMPSSFLQKVGIGYVHDRIRRLSMALSDQIRKRRQEQGISLTELARRSRISKGISASMNPSNAI